MNEASKRHLEAAGKKYALLCQIATVGRDFIYDEEKEAIEYFIQTLQARLEEIHRPYPFFPRLLYEQSYPSQPPELSGTIPQGA